MKKSKKKKIAVTAAVILAVIVIALMAASEYMLNFALCPKENKGRNYQKELPVMKERYPWIAHWTDSLDAVHAIRDTFVTASDGDRHHALIIKSSVNTPLTAVIVPGYTDGAIDMLHAGYIYNHLMNMNVVIPDLHGNGKSDGDKMQMGCKDRIDVIQWVAIADSLFKGGASHADIVLHGQSMGAATVMNVSGELASPVAPELIANGRGREIGKAVKCYVEDCGYTSAWDEFSYELDSLFGLPDFPILYSASALCKLQNGWSFGEASPLKQVAKCHKPMLFVHGGNDDFVPTRMVYSLYEAKPAPKYLMVFPGSKHARSYCDHRTEYEKKVTSFVSKYI